MITWLLMYYDQKSHNLYQLLLSSSSSLSSLSSLSTTSISCILELVLVPRVLSSSSFVEATIQLHIPNTYVHNSDLEINASDDSYSYVPKLVIVRTSGLADEGRQLLLSVQKLYSTFLPGDQVLYQLIEAI